MDSITEAIILSKKLTDAPVVAISINRGKPYTIVGIYSDKQSFNHIDEMLVSEGARFVCFHETDVLSSILRDGGRSLSRVLVRPIVIKDELSIMPFIMEYLHPPVLDPPSIGGELIIRFNGSIDSRVFLSNTLLPLLSTNKSYLEKAGSFCLFSRFFDRDYVVFACWDHFDQRFSYRDFMYHLVKELPESNLHTFSIDYNPSPSKHISLFQQWSTSVFLPLLGRDYDEDVIIREVFSQYLSLAKRLYNNAKDFLYDNRITLEKMTLLSLSSVTKGVVVNSMRDIVVSKILSEYKMMMRTNMEELLQMLEKMCSNWTEYSESVIPDTVLAEISELMRRKGARELSNVFFSLFSASLMHPFFTGFIPYCINEQLPMILHL